MLVSMPVKITWLFLLVATPYVASHGTMIFWIAPSVALSKAEPNNTNAEAGRAYWRKRNTCAGLKVHGVSSMEKRRACIECTQFPESCNASADLKTQRAPTARTSPTDSSMNASLAKPSPNRAIAERDTAVASVADAADHVAAERIGNIASSSCAAASDGHLRGAVHHEILDCVTLRMLHFDASSGSLHVAPSTCQAEKQPVHHSGQKPTKVWLHPPAESVANEGYCLIVPCHVSHYQYLDRLLRGVLRFATDRVRVLTVFSDDAALALAEFCTHFPRTCASMTAADQWEVTDLPRLIDASFNHEENYWLTSILVNALPSDRGKVAEKDFGVRRERAHRQLANLRDNAWYTRPLKKVSDSASFSKVHNLYIQALKKMLATAYAGCKRAWIVDSESLPFRPFSFQSIFNGYWSNPVVYHNGPASPAVDAAAPEANHSKVLSPEDTSDHVDQTTFDQSRAGADSAPFFSRIGSHKRSALGWCAEGSHEFKTRLVECRGTLLDHYSSLLLGLPKTGHPYSHNDYWHWDAAVMRAALKTALMAQNKHGNSAPRFLEAFVRSPTHELMYYSFAEASGSRTHRFEPIERALDSFYRDHGFPHGGYAEMLSKMRAHDVVVAPDTCRAAPEWRKSMPLPHFTVGDLLSMAVPHAYELLVSLGYRGIKWNVNPFLKAGPCSQSVTCFKRILKVMARACDANSSIPGQQNTAVWEGSVDWLLSFEFAPTSCKDLHALAESATNKKALEQALKRYLSTGGRRETLTAEAAPSTVRPKLLYYDFDLLLVPRSSRGGQTPPTMKFRPSHTACPAVRHAVSCKLSSLTDGVYLPSEDRCNVSALATGSWWFPLAERVS